MSGKEVALARRRAISQNGGSAIPKKNGAVAARVKPTPAAIASTTPAATVNTIPAVTASAVSAGSAVSGRDFSRARRAMLASGGKNGVGSSSASKVSAPVKAVAPASTYASSEINEPARYESAASTSDVESTLDSICSVVEQTP
ncbi:MAG: hypothetical protein Q8N54_01600, partial [Sulfurimicrobium sp.]|nr:hypothetical protein [Sulfurimicrobium sp.]